MRHIVWLMVCLLAMPSAAVAGELFRWVDESGRVHYGDAPPKEIKNAERKDLSGNNDPDVVLPYETQRAQENFPVTFYVNEGCVETCTRARELLRKRGIPYTEKSIKTREEFDALSAQAGKAGFPTLSVGKTYLVGYLETSWNNELTLVGYPKTASYSQRIAPPPEPKKPAESDSEESSGQVEEITNEVVE